MRHTRHHTQDLSIPVIAIDGEAGTGKGSARAGVAKKLGFNEHDSGVLYRALGLKCEESGVNIEDEDACAQIADQLDVVVKGETVILDGVDRTKEVRSDKCGKLASIVGKSQKVHDSIDHIQLQMRKAPGTVADGRDMGFIFDTPFRFFLKARQDVRAQRRVKEFEAKGLDANYDTILAEIIRRDISDQTRAVAPLKIHPEAIIVDTSDIDRNQVVEVIVKAYEDIQKSLVSNAKS